MNDLYKQVKRYLYIYYNEYMYHYYHLFNSIILIIHYFNITY